ncbi:hypothetical protein WH367_16505 [Comamonas sp. MYb21]|uniref:hypothetical protein n=1 Tax=Comamonas sp. MYb21 TaxID=1848648 RepID=UPI0030A50B57
MIQVIQTDEIRALGSVLFGDCKDEELIAALACVQMPTEAGRCIQFAIRTLESKDLAADFLSVYGFIQSPICTKRFPSGSAQATAGLLIAAVIQAFPKEIALEYFHDLAASSDQ